MHLTKAHRTDGAAEEGTTLRRAEEYGHSMFRHFYTMRKGDVSPWLGNKFAAGCNRCSNFSPSSSLSAEWLREL